MKILLLGKNGQVGWELQRSLAPLGEVLALDRYSSRHCGDLSQLDALTQTVLAFKPDFIVNAAAHTAVDKAESEPELAKLLNTDAPAALAKAAAQVGAWLVHTRLTMCLTAVAHTPGKRARAQAPGCVWPSQARWRKSHCGQRLQVFDFPHQLGVCRTRWQLC